MKSSTRPATGRPVRWWACAGRSLPLARSLVLCLLAFLVLAGRGLAADVLQEELAFDSEDGRVTMTRFFVPPAPLPVEPAGPDKSGTAQAPQTPPPPAGSAGAAFPGARVQTPPAPQAQPQPEPPRPCVIVLHGRQGIAPLRDNYETYCRWLAAKGYQAYLLSYYSQPDAQAMEAKDPQIRRERYDQRLSGWVQRVRDAITCLSARKDVDPARIALLGFSQGGFVAVGAAGQDRRPAALVCVYGGLPQALRAAAQKLPPTLIVHGEADTVVPVAEARALAAAVVLGGGEVVEALYPGEGHGFALSLKRPEAKDAFAKTTQFLEEHLRNRRPVAR